MRLSLLFAGLSWRAGASIAMLAVAVVGVAVGAFGPIYLHSADQAILNTTLATAAPGDTGLTLEPNRVNGAPDLSAAVSRVPSSGGGRKWFGAPIVTADAGINLVSGGSSFIASLISRTGVCSHVAVVVGRCPTGRSEVMMSARSAHEAGLRVGSHFEVTISGSRASSSLIVVGLYRPGDASAPYWWGTNYFAYGTGSAQRPLLDDVFATRDAIYQAAPRTAVSQMIQLPLESRSISVDDSSRLRSAVNRFETDVLQSDDIVASSRLPNLLSQANATEHTTTTVVLVIDLQLVLLALFVLYFVSARTAVEREPDIRLAELRGFPPRSMLAVAMAEPVAILLASAPLGLLLAWLVASAMASLVFGAGIGASVTLLAVGAAIATGVVGIGAVALGTRQVVTAVQTGAASAIRSATQRASTWRVIADVSAVAIGAAAFVELSIAGVSGSSGGSRTDPLAAFAPGLLALALGVLGARLLPVVLRTTFARSANSKKVALALATRRVARRSEFAPQVVLTTISVGLAIFGICGWAIAARNHDVRTQFDVGAPKVLTVTVRPGVDFVDAVRGADPSGKYAMAAVVETSSDGTTLAVDSSRIAKVASWPPGLGAGGAHDVERHLVPSGLALPVQVAGHAIALSIDSTIYASPRPQLSVDLFDEGFQTPQQVVLGTLVPGDSTYEASIEGLCPSGCRLGDLAITWAPPIAVTTPSGSAQLTISSVSELSDTAVWAPVRAGLDDVARWTSRTGGAQLSSSPKGLTANVSLNAFGVPVTIAPADVPSALPTVVTPGSSPGGLGGGGTLALVGLDGATVTGRSVGEVPALPRVGSAASLVDLGLADRFLSGPSVDVATEIWLAGNAPPSLMSRLSQRGISLVSVDSAVADEHASIRGGVNLAYTLFLLAAVASGALAVGVTGFAVAAGARRRAAELSAMRAVGLGARSLRHSVELEQTLTLLTGTLLGVGAGVVSAVVALRSIPEFVSLAPGPPLELGMPGLVLLLTLVALVVAFVAIVALGASVVTASASPEKLGAIEA